MRLLVPFVACLLCAPVLTQGPPSNGPVRVDPGWHALVGATVVTEPGTRLDDATVVIRNGRIVAVGKAPPPVGARVHDCKGLTLYPGLIEPFLAVDVPAPDPAAHDTHWNPNVLPQRSALDGHGVAAGDREQLRALGFTAAGIAPTGGVLKGSSAVVLLDEPEPGERARVLRQRASTLCSLRPGSGYPNAQMGAIALLRQTLLDADWYERCQATIARRPELAARGPQPSAVLAALSAQRALPLWFDVDDEQEVLRAARIAAEFQRAITVVGSGMEFRRLDAIAAAKVPLVVPLHWPEAPDVSSLAKQERVSLRHLQSWEHARSNSRRLLDAGVTIAWTTARLPDRKEFRQRVADALATGVDREQALAALTTVPARLLGLEQELGRIAVGHHANLVVAAGDLFDPKTRIRAVWVGGVPHEVTPARGSELIGEWTCGPGLPGIAAGAARLRIDDERVALVIGDDQQRAQDVQRGDGVLDCRIAHPGLGQKGDCVLHLRIDGAVLRGKGMLPDGTELSFAATRAAPAAAPTAAAPAATSAPAMARLPLPLGGYGFVEPPPAVTTLVRDVTLWTGDDRGVVERGAVLFQQGRIVFAGRTEDLPEIPAGATVVDGRGKHLTPGLIDCHSHTGISRGINESGQAVTAEVRVQDVIDADDVNWYRQLAGGVTTVNQLHGSANAIGGQSSTVKVRWGCRDPDEMRFLGAPGGIKFALGENPRRANSDGNNDRYPNTRMGVEALIRDRFVAAAEYRRRRTADLSLSPQQRAEQLPVRVDLELEALADVLADRRRIHCHSYRQDEIFMLCGLAREFGIRIGTFQHVLEGYKVAEAIAAAGAGASSFSDWWAYKFEVYDAIPDNGAILHAAGVVVSFNSDSNELARRLNTEAGKAVKYGGVPRAAALQFVTRNPAIQLGIADRVGTLAAGKDADLALWSGDPLSYASRCEATWVDGRLLWSAARDRELRDGIAAERRRLLPLALAAGRQRPDRRDDARDAYWRAEDTSEHYCCRDCEGGAR